MPPFSVNVPAPGPVPVRTMASFTPAAASSVTLPPPAALRILTDCDVSERHRLPPAAVIVLPRIVTARPVGVEVQRVVVVPLPPSTVIGVATEGVIVNVSLSWVAWVHADQGRRGDERTLDHHVRAGVSAGSWLWSAVMVIVAAGLDRRAGRNVDVVSRLERDGRAGGLDRHPRIHRQVIAGRQRFRRRQR